ncbi:hypothetical protein NGM99_10450 [Mesorhizobium sp. RP14(2022)]|uniref:Uncharacterized protein n=1 Tax=Mesorhizobium liriopis TaxID=2953882 RepID=A0ABT1C5V2_9HYPH|nr:hypothetical protein [Mesorhizobium liriopis]MCO6050204.1 hypothetical protein [Mesorhizobium liriopis]
MPLLPRLDKWNNGTPELEAKRRPYVTVALLLKIGLCVVAGWVAYHQFSRVAFDAPSTHSNVPAVIH